MGPARLWTLVLLQLAFWSGGSEQLELSDKLVYKFVNTYRWIWDDKGSKAEKDISIWRPVEMSGFFAVGDVAQANHARPDFYAMVVRDEQGKTSRPESFELVWTDKGSKASKDVAVYRMICPAGFSSLGHVAVGSHTEQPNKDIYRCVQTSLLTSGVYRQIWIDRKSQAAQDVGLWLQGESNSFPNGLSSSTFYAQSNWDTPNGKPNVVDHFKSVEASLLPSNTNASLVLRPAKMELVWKDTGSGGQYDVATFTPENCVRLADSAVGNYRDEPLGYCVQEMEPDVLVRPNGFSYIWNDRGSGAAWDGSFWRFNCPAGYLSLGHASKRDHGAPNPENYRCVQAKYVTPGTFNWVWNDRGSGSVEDVSVFEVNAAAGGIGVDALYAVNGYRNPDEDALVLNSKDVVVKSGKPVSKIKITKVDYKIDMKKLISAVPFAAQPTSVSNCGSGSVDQKVVRRLGYSETVTSSWHWDISVEVGVEVKWETGVPLIGGAETTLSLKVTTGYGQEYQTSKETTDEKELEINVPAKSKTSAWIVGKKATMDVPFTAHATYTYSDNSQSTGVITGTYWGLEITDVDFQYGDVIPC